MKKSKMFTVFAVCMVLVLMLTGCKSKTAITTDTFKTTMSEQGFTVVDGKDQYAEFDYILEVYAAVDSTQSYQVEFYQCSDETYAKGMYENNKAKFEEQHKSASVHTAVSVGNHSEFRLLADGEYILISQIDDTFLFVHTTAEYKDAVNDIADALGY